MLQEILSQQKNLKREVRKNFRAYTKSKEESSLEDFKESLKELSSFLKLRNLFEKGNIENEDGYKVGDVLFAIWGYDCTIIDFYKVVRTSKKMIWVVPVESTKEYGHGCGYYAGLIKAGDKFKSFEAQKVKSSNPYIDSHYLHRYDGKKHYFSDPD